MKSHYVLQCHKCGAPAADCVRICPYCGGTTDFPGLGEKGVSKSEDGSIRVEDGAHIDVGGTGPRDCPFCGASASSEAKHCRHCGAKIVIEYLRISRLVIEGGSMTVHAGGRLEIVGRRLQPIHEFARAGDLDKVKERVLSGSDPNLQDEKGQTALHYSAAQGHLEVCKWLVSVGATPDQKSDDGHTPKAASELAGQQLITNFLNMVGG